MFCVDITRLPSSNMLLLAQCVRILFTTLEAENPTFCPFLTQLTLKRHLTFNLQPCDP